MPVSATRSVSLLLAALPSCLVSVPSLICFSLDDRLGPLQITLLNPLKGLPGDIHLGTADTATPTSFEFCTSIQYHYCKPTDRQLAVHLTVETCDYDTVQSV